MRNYSYPAPMPCETEWTSRSLTELVAHLSLRYRRPLQQRLESVRSLLREVGPCEAEASGADNRRLADSFERLRGALEEHAWLEDEVLCPAVARAEYSVGSSDPRARDALCMLVMTVPGEHRLIRSRMEDLEGALLTIVESRLSEAEALLVTDLEMVQLLLDEQMNIEDRCLWPRVLVLLQPWP